MLTKLITMNFQKLINDLAAIQANPRPQSVKVTVSGNRTTYLFYDAYYYPAGIVQIIIQRGGAGVVYVFTTVNVEYPHLTIPDTGQNVHWSISAGSSTTDQGKWPVPVQRFVALYP